MKSEVIQLTPARAKYLLSLNRKNRPLNRQHSDELARRMKAGEWRLNGETIITGSETGETTPDDLLLDGQHRCDAVVKSGVTVEILHVSGIRRDVFPTLDVGKIRTHADVVAIDGQAYATQKAATVKLVDRYLNHRMRQVRYSGTEVLALLAEHPMIERSIKACNGGTNAKWLPKSVLMAAHYLFLLVDEEAANQFVARLIDGVGLEEGSPILLLRNRLINGSMSRDKMRLTTDYTFGIIIKAWNAWRAGRNLRTLRFIMTGDQAEAFPEVL